MYIAVMLILLGWSLGVESRALWIYTVFIALAFHVRVVTHEEPFLAGTHGPDWEEYRARVPGGWDGGR